MEAGYWSSSPRPQPPSCKPVALTKGLCAVSPVDTRLARQPYTRMHHPNAGSSRGVETTYDTAKQSRVCDGRFIHPRDSRQRADTGTGAAFPTNGTTRGGQIRNCNSCQTPTHAMLEATTDVAIRACPPAAHQETRFHPQFFFSILTGFGFACWTPSATASCVRLVCPSIASWLCSESHSAMNRCHCADGQAFNALVSAAAKIGHRTGANVEKSGSFAWARRANERKPSKSVLVFFFHEKEHASQNEVYFKVPRMAEVNSLGFLRASGPQRVQCPAGSWPQRR